MGRETIAFVMSAAFAALAVGESVRADPSTYRTFHPADCLVQSGSVSYTNFGQVQSASSGTAELWCPAPHDSYLPLTSGGNLKLTVYEHNTGCTAGFQCNPIVQQDCLGNTNGTNNVCFRACRTYYGGGSPGGTCTGWYGNPYSGDGYMWLTSPTPWTNGSWDDTYYVDIFLCATCSSDHNAVFSESVNL